MGIYSFKIVRCLAIPGRNVDEVNCPRFHFVYNSKLKTYMIMKKQFLLFLLMMLPMVASAFDIEVKKC